MSQPYTPLTTLLDRRPRQPQYVLTARGRMVVGTLKFLFTALNIGVVFGLGTLVVLAWLFGGQ